MAELRPYPLASLATRMFRELSEQRSIFDLPEKRFFLGSPDHDLSVTFHGHRASSPLGPAAGPQTQMAQNIVLSWLAGCRVMELKTVQILDELEIGRPCIDMHNVGYNIEWSQELKLEQSLEEYVKGAMLVEMLRASGELDLVEGFGDVIYDMSVGYDLEGIRHPRVQEFIRGMLDCSATVDRLRGEIPDSLARFRDLEYPTRLSDTLTLSTFHGCPPDEIEGIIDFLLRELGLHCVIKLNPTLLGPERVHELLNHRLGYSDIEVPSEAFAKDATWDQMLGFVRRLRKTADDLELGLGVKFTNTLIVKNQRDFFPATEKEMYLSGPPLHVLAMQLVADLRDELGGEVPISFSAGIDRKNFSHAVALGLVPVTVCSDLLKPGGYARAGSYLKALIHTMDQLQVTTIDDLVLARPDPAAGRPGDLSTARERNARAYADGLPGDPRYSREQNKKLPPKIGRRLELFDCITCDKCVPVCPNHANFTFQVPPGEIPRIIVRREGSVWSHERVGSHTLEERHQIGNFVDFCNDCGNCDVFCPEDGGPYVLKPRFFTSLETWSQPDAGDGVCLVREPEGTLLAGRFQGSEYRAWMKLPVVEYSGPGFSIRFAYPEDPLRILDGEARGDVDLTYYFILVRVTNGIAGSLNYVALAPSFPAP